MVNPLSARQCAAAVVALVAWRAAPAQTPVSRADAIEATVTGGARIGFARADTAVAHAQLLAARARQNPGLSTTYSRAVPSYHVTLDIPLGLPGQRGARVGSARAARTAAQYRFAFERAAAALDADTTYTRALAARARAGLSRRNALAADSLRELAAARRDAGDASDLEVELALMVAGQAANLAATDSLAYLSALLDLQTVMGLVVDRVSIVPTDSLQLPADVAAIPDSGRSPGAAPLQVAAAQAALESARLTTQLQRRSRFGSPGLMVGLETGDPAAPGMLPTFGLSMPIPLLNRNGGGIRLAEAEQARARALVALAAAQSGADIARARRELAIALDRFRRDALLVVAADRVAAMSLIAYREGASPLPTVLEARRNARDVLGQYIDDLAAAWIAAARLRVLTLAASGDIR